jgi:hypothetical protein
MGLIFDEHVPVPRRGRPCTISPNLRAWCYILVLAHTMKKRHNKRPLSVVAATKHIEKYGGVAMVLGFPAEGKATRENACLSHARIEGTEPIPFYTPYHMPSAHRIKAAYYAQKKSLTQDPTLEFALGNMARDLAGLPRIPLPNRALPGMNITFN